MTASSLARLPVQPVVAADSGGTLLSQTFRDTMRISLELCDAAGNLGDAAQGLDQQTDSLHQILAATQQITASNAAVSQRVRSMAGGAEDVGRSLARAVGGMTGRLRTVKGNVQKLTESASRMDQRFSDVGSQVTELRRSSANIQTVAREIQLLAVNAGVEAARHGAAGRGFAVIAEAVKKLADQTRLTTALNDRLLADLTETVTGLRAQAAENLTSTVAAREGVEEVVTTADSLDGVSKVICGLIDGLSSINEPIASNAEACASVLGHLQSGSRGVDDVNREIQTVNQRMDRVLSMAEAISSTVLDSSADTPVSHLATACKTTAATISRCFEDALRTGRISMADLFDERYRLVPNSNPQQHMAAFTGFTDAVLPAIQEPLLKDHARVIFCAAVDRNGYLPTHNLAFSQPQGADPVWNAQHARNRRIFDDRTGLNSARNKRPVLLQTYRRDMGGGHFAIINELASPIIVNGRHWGGFRIGFKN